MIAPEQILAAIDKCTTLDEVANTAKQYAAEFKAINDNPETRTRGIHIKNLAKYKRREINGHLAEKFNSRYP